uniref:ATP synthase F0 subunit 8 n=1 Tax=Rhynchocyon stuhlmanni TaxID=3036954 RepID=UPI002434E01E|nr:ATP synthase F0 subunit 8 [Rhynchocyon stuhlmanni]WEW63476.1 ATP synthase F0 subunit 8 [Rhynchocyon stuhlmanni]WEW63502.1 ATP synthase F0 subunit 8 [Rhynchocyon stuhlmanni]
MPQLDTSTWFINILSMLLALYIIFQLKISKFSYPSDPQPQTLKPMMKSSPWETKWTKIYLPHL